MQIVIFRHGFGAGENRGGVSLSICRRGELFAAGFVSLCRNIGITRRAWFLAECFSVGGAEAYASFSRCQIGLTGSNDQEYVRFVG